MLNLEKKRNTLKKLRDKGKSNFLLFIPCLIAYFFVSVYYFFALHLDMLLSDKDGRFLGIEKHGKANKYAASAPKKRAPHGDDYTPGGSRVKTGARIVSAFLMVCFAFTFLPTLGVDFGLTLDIFAATSITAPFDTNGDAPGNGTIDEINYGDYLVSLNRSGYPDTPTQEFYTISDIFVNKQTVTMNLADTGAGDGKLIINFEKSELSDVAGKYTAPILNTYISIYGADGNLTRQPITVNYGIDRKANDPIIELQPNELEQSTLTYEITNEYQLPLYTITKRNNGYETSRMVGSGTDTSLSYYTTGMVDWGIATDASFYKPKDPVVNGRATINNGVFSKKQGDTSFVNAEVNNTDPLAPNGKVDVTWGKATDADGYILHKINRDTGNEEGEAIVIEGEDSLTYPGVGDPIYTLSEKSTVYDFEIIPYKGLTLSAATKNPVTETSYFMYGTNSGGVYGTVVSLMEAPRAHVSYNTAVPIAPKGYRVGWNVLNKISDAAEAVGNPSAAGYYVYRLPLANIIRNSAGLPGGDLTESSTPAQVQDFLRSDGFLAENMALMRNTQDGVFTVSNKSTVYEDTEATEGVPYYYAITAFRKPDAEYESKPLFIPTTLTPRPGVPNDFEVQPNKNMVYIKWDAVQTNVGQTPATYADSYILDITLLDAAGNPTNQGGQREVTVNTPSALRAYFDANGKMTTPIAVDYYYENGTNQVNIVDGNRYSVVIHAVDDRIHGSNSSQIKILVGGDPVPPVNDQSIITRPSENTVTIEWAAVPEADFYEIVYGERDSSGQVATWSSPPTRVNTNRFVHGNLQNGKYYGYKITAVKNVGTGAIANDNLVTETLKSSESSVIYGVVGSNIPAPVDPRFTQTGNSVVLAWTAGEDNGSGITITGYYVNITGSDGSSQTIPIRGTTYTHTIPEEGVYYTYSVQAYAVISGIPTRSTSLDYYDRGYVAPPASTKPATPLDFTATAEGETGVKLAWTDPQTPSGYIVYGKNGVVTSAAAILSSPDYNSGFISQSKKDHVDTTLAAGQTRSYVVVAYRQTGDTHIESNPTVVRTYPPTGGGDVTPPGGTGSGLSAPLDFLVTTTDGNAELTWAEVPGAYGYRVHASGPSGNVVFDRSEPDFTHAPLLNGEKWTYYVTALTQSGSGYVEGVPSPSYTVTIGVSLNQPQDFRFTAGNRQIDLEWSDVTGAEGYIVYQYNQSLMQFEPISVVTEAKYSAMGLTNDREYTFMVAGYKTINGTQHLSQYSMSVTAKPTTGSPTDLDRKITVKGTAPYGMDRSDLMGAYANHGAFDGDVDIYIQTIDSSTEAIKNALSGFANGLSSFIVYPFDITLYQAGTYIEPVLNPGYTVTITLPLPDELVRYRDYIQVMHLNDSGTLENLRSSLAEIEGTWCIQFPVIDFSPFAFVIYRDQIIDAASGTGTFGAFASNAFGQIVNFPQAMLPFGLKIQRGKRRVFRILKIGRKV